MPSSPDILVNDFFELLTTKHYKNKTTSEHVDAFQQFKDTLSELTVDGQSDIKASIYARAIENDVFEINDPDATRKVLQLLVSSKVEITNLPDVIKDLVNATTTKEKIAAVMNAQDSMLASAIYRLTDDLNKVANDISESVIQEARGFLFALVDNSPLAQQEFIDALKLNPKEFPKKMIEIFDKYAPVHPFELSKNKKALVSSTASGGQYDALIINEDNVFIPLLATADQSLKIEGDSLFRHALSALVLQELSKPNEFEFIATPSKLDDVKLSENGINLLSQLESLKTYFPPMASKGISDNIISQIILQVRAPISKEDLLDKYKIKGLGKSKLAEFGDELISAINACSNQNMYTTNTQPLNTHTKSTPLDSIPLSNIEKLLGIEKPGHNSKQKLKNVTRVLNKKPELCLNLLNSIYNKETLSSNLRPLQINADFANWISDNSNPVFVGATSASNFDDDAYLFPTNAISERIFSTMFAHHNKVQEESHIHNHNITFAEDVSLLSLQADMYKNDNQMIILPTSDKAEKIHSAIQSVDSDFILNGIQDPTQTTIDALKGFYPSTPPTKQTKKTIANTIMFAFSICKDRLIANKSDKQVQEDLESICINGLDNKLLSMDQHKQLEFGLEFVNMAKMASPRP
jgi:hypothetical protein